MWDLWECLQRSTRALTGSSGSSEVICQNRLNVLTGRSASSAEGGACRSKFRHGSLSWSGRADFSTC
ncbi:unnamed protein product [Prunus armeniaca]